MVWALATPGNARRARRSVSVTARVAAAAVRGRRIGVVHGVLRAESGAW